MANPLSTATDAPPIERQHLPASLAALLIFAAVLLAYAPAFRADWSWDDDVCVYKNPLVIQPGNLAKIWLTTQSNDYWPASQTFLWAEYRLFGDKPMGYHIVAVILHGVVSAGLFLLLRQLKVPAAWPAALLFAVHPVAVPSVAWISEIKNTLSLLFLILAFLCHLRLEGRRARLWYALALIAFALALASKTSVVLMPAALLGLAWWKNGQVTRRDVVRSVPFFLLAAAMAVMTLLTQGRQLEAGSLAQALDGPYRLAGAGWAVWFYLGKMLVPVHLSMIYPHWKTVIELLGWLSFLPAAALLALLAILWIRRRTEWGRPAFLAAVFLLFALFPVLGFFRMTYMMHSLVSDHFLYLPLAVFIPFVCAAGARLTGLLRPEFRQLIVIPLIAILLVLGAFTWQRTDLFREQESLWRDTVRRNDEAWMAHYNLANQLLKRARTTANPSLLREAEHHYREAIDIQPRYDRPHNNLACMLVESGRIHDGLRDFWQGIKIERTKPVERRSVQLYINLEHSLVQAGQLAEALAVAAEELEIAEKRHNAALARDIRERMTQYETRLKIEPQK